MSVINKMLKDLEQNSAPVNDTGVILKKENNNQLLIRIIIFLLLSLVLVLGAKIYLPEKATKNKQMLLKTQVQPSESEIVNEKMPTDKLLESVSEQKIKVTTQQIPKEETELVSVASTEKETITRPVAVEVPVLEKAVADVVPETIKEPVQQVVKVDAVVEAKKINLKNQPEKNRSDFTIQKQKIDPVKRAQQLWKKAEAEPQYAEQYLQRAILLDPHLHGARLQLIALQLSKQNIYAAESTINQGLSLFNNDARYLEWKARLLLAAGEKQQAKNWLLKSTPLLNTHINYYGILAGIENQLGEYQSAADIYQRLVKAQPGHGPWLLGLALAQQKQGNIDVAKITYVQATAGDGLSSRAKAFIQQQIRKLEH
ncbi:MAG TPA: hypothetical protein ENJ60_10710 [Aeromonadales bacterium]|nr:hypothetical protein [Aeromonadales bacterium]